MNAKAGPLAPCAFFAKASDFHFLLRMIACVLCFISMSDYSKFECFCCACLTSTSELVLFVSYEHPDGHYIQNGFTSSMSASKTMHTRYQRRAIE